MLDLTFPCLCGGWGLLIYITTLKNGEYLRLALAKILSAMGSDSVYKNEPGFKSFGWRSSNMTVTYGNISWVLSQGVPDFWNHDLIKVLQHVTCFRKSWKHDGLRCEYVRDCRLRRSNIAFAVASSEPPKIFQWNFCKRIYAHMRSLGSTSIRWDNLIHAWKFGQNKILAANTRIFS